MGVLLFQLQRLICRRAAFRDKSLQPSIHTMEISSVSWTRMRLFNSKLSIEKNWSEGLSTIQARYKYIIHDVQTTLDVHKSLQETSAYQTKPDIRLRANAAVVDLEENSASFDRRVRRILHAVFLTDKEARRYTWTL